MSCGRFADVLAGNTLSAKSPHSTGKNGFTYEVFGNILPISNQISMEAEALGATCQSTVGRRD